MKKMNPASKYLIYVCVVLIMFNAFLGMFLTRQSSRAMKNLINNRMLDISNTAAAMLDGDELENLKAEDINSPEYQNVLKMLTYFQENIELEFIYCIKDMGDKNFILTVDPTATDPGAFGTPIVYTDALYRASLGLDSVDEKPYEDKWGRFYSSYSPVFDSKHKVAGIVAVDFSASWYEEQIRGLIWTTILMINIALVFSIVIAAIVATQYKNNMGHVFREMNELSDGIETLMREVSPEDVPELRESKIERTGVGFKDEITMLVDKILSMQERLSEHISIIRSRAYIDGLTGLNNRTSYEEFTKQLQKRSIEDQRLYYSIVVFDVNQLKIINDDYGHEEGDHIITQVASAMKQTFPDENLFRIGGDEFVGIIKGVDPKPKIDSFREQLCNINENDKLLKENSLEITVSIGYAVYDRDTDYDYAEVFERADMAMYADKREYYKTHEDRRKRK
jgi:diguanylate cyclase (GGDEF)-like protein